MLPEVWVSQWKKARVTNYSTNGYPTRVNTLTEPSGDGVIPCGTNALGQPGASTCPHIMIKPFGAGADNVTMGMKVLGWTRTGMPAVGVRPVWLLDELITFAITLSASVGIVDGEVSATDRFADTITSTGGPTFITSAALPVILDWFQTSPTTDGPAVIKQPTFGYDYLELIFTTGGSATSCNALWRKA